MRCARRVLGRLRPDLNHQRKEIDRQNTGPNGSPSKAWIVSGPTSGIGRRTALELAGHGIVVLIGRDPDKLRDLEAAGLGLAPLGELVLGRGSDLRVRNPDGGACRGSRDERDDQAPPPAVLSGLRLTRSEGHRARPEESARRSASHRGSWRWRRPCR